MMNDTQSGATRIPVNSVASLELEFDGDFHKIQWIDKQSQIQIPEQRQNLDEFEKWLAGLLRWYRFTVDPDFGKDKY